MTKLKGGYTAWIGAGYELFAKEGSDGIQVERLARILDLNKSGFYHFFGDRDTYFEDLLKFHQKKIDLFCHDISNCQSMDPDVITLMVQYGQPLMFNLQLVRNRHIKMFHEVCVTLNEKINAVLARVWSDYIGLQQYPELARRYFHIILDMLYSRIGSDSFTYEAIQTVLNEAKQIVSEVRQEIHGSKKRYARDKGVVH